MKLIIGLSIMALIFILSGIMMHRQYMEAIDRTKIFQAKASAYQAKAVAHQEEAKKLILEYNQKLKALENK